MAGNSCHYLTVTMFFVALTLAIVGAVVAVAAGLIDGSLADPSTSLSPRGLPDGPIGPADLDRVRLSVALRGYRMREVDQILQRLGRELADRELELRKLRLESLDAPDSSAASEPSPAAAPDLTKPAVDPVDSAAPVEWSGPIVVE